MTTMRLIKGNLLLIVLVVLIASIDVLVFNAYPFLCEKPWSYDLLFSSMKALYAYIFCSCTHYVVLDVGFIAVPFLYLYTVGFKLSRKRRLWPLVTLLAILIVLDVSTVVLIDYVALLSPLSRAREVSLSALPTLIIIVSNLDTIVKLWIAPLILPIVVVYPVMRNVRALVSKALGRVVIACLCNFLVSQVIAPLIRFAIDAAIASFNPLAMFAYFRCIDPQVARYIAMDFQLKVSFIPVLQTWGGVAEIFITLIVASIISKWLASFVHEN